MGEPIVAQNVSYTYRQQVNPRPAVDSVNLSVAAGEFVCIMGPSGSGKSTLIRLIAGLQTPDDGSIKVGAKEISKATPDEAAVFRRRHVGLVFQFFDLIPDFTLRQNVAIQLLMDGERMPRVRGRVDSILQRLGLAERMDQPLDRLSGGELQRVAIARALVAEPSMVLADEPTANLEERSADEAIQLFSTACRQHRVTTVVVTHNSAFRNIADRTFLMRDGRLHEEGR